QAVLNILTSARYKSIAKETEGVLKGEYGATPAPVDQKLQKRVLKGAEPISCRPADLLEPEFDKQRVELLETAKNDGFDLVNEIDDTLTYALFPWAGLKFLKNRSNPEVFEPLPQDRSGVASTEEDGLYTVEVDGREFTIRASDGPHISWRSGTVRSATPARLVPEEGGDIPVPAPIAGTVYKSQVKLGDKVKEGDVILILEAMKMETEICSPAAGTVNSIKVALGDRVKVGQLLITLH
ncbi:MAG: biotin/lipoyl-containing protein, partial [Gammaproteobacteria bacterium]